MPPEVDDILASFDSDESYYEEVKEVSIPKGTYPAHIVDMSVKRDIKTKQGNICDLYHLTYQLADSEYANSQVNDTGIFRFKTSLDPSNQRVRAGNFAYKQTLDKLGIEMEKVNNGSGSTIYKLPNITKDMVMGLPVIINVFKNEYHTRNGMRKETAARLLRSWDEGEKQDVE
tara:strand:+ start:524 stop:1042 length:519 start_codon:yes stop_codon:yes gene_type:complete